MDQPLFTRLVVPLDGSPQANAALPLATGLAQALDIPVLLARAVPLPAEIASARKHLAGVAHELRQNHVRVQEQVSVGAAADEITRLLAPGDLVLLGLAARPDPGAVTRRLLEDVQTPVILRRAGGKRIVRVRCLGVVGAEPALVGAQALAARLNAPLVGVTASAANVDLLVTKRAAAAGLALDPACQLPVLAV